MNAALQNARLEAMVNDRGKPTVLVFPEMAQGAWADQDWGSAGPVCIASGKDGIAYPIKTANLGGTNSWVIFAWGENSQLHKWKVSPMGESTYVAESHEYASDNVREKPPGGFCSGSSNGRDPDSALLFCTIPYGDANANVVNGRFLVYDPVHLAPDGFLKVLWDSQRWNVPFLFNKFDPPVVSGGQIYVPNYNGGVDVYRLAR